MTVLCDLQPHNDLDLHLPQVDEFIAKIFCRKHQSDKSDFHPTSKFLEFLEHELPINFSGSGEYTYFYLAIIEKWVEDHLSSWLERHISDNTTCEHLQSLLKEYFNCAKSAYSGVSNIPGSLSIMYLTATELWIACDKCACKMYPLLQNFDPEVDISSFESLSLPFKSQLKRLFTVEAHLESRRINTRANAPSLYRDFGLPSSFAVIFFNESSEHQRLRSDIEQHATERRQQKCHELAEQKKLYHDLMTRSDNRSCDRREVYNRRYNYTSTEHAPWCEKCRLRFQAEQLQIQVHEWPLSPDQAIAKATVFELQIPKAYSHWRDATMFLRIQVLCFTYANARELRARYILSEQDGLSSFWASPSDQRISLISENKPLSGSHYRVKEGVAFLQEKDVCVDNALHFDNLENTFSEILCSSQQVPKKCTYQLPARSSQIQAYLRTHPTSNDITPNHIIAGLSSCPSHFSLDEYKAFASLPIGYRIQYQNILVQLAMPVVDFTKIETQSLILQTLHRAGPLSSNNSVERTAHEILANESFCRALTDKIEASLERVSENWNT